MTLIELQKKYPELTLEGEVYKDFAYMGCKFEDSCSDEVLQLAHKVLREEISPTAEFLNFGYSHGRTAIHIRYEDNWDPSFRGVFYKIIRKVDDE